MREHRGPSLADGGRPAEAPILAVLFVDISDSTRLYRTLGDERARAVVLASLSRLGGVVTGLGGAIVDSIGDELMCTFDSALEAVTAAVALQRSATELARGVEQGVDISVRIGLDVGPVVQKSGRVFGRTVYTARRMATLAKPRQVVTTAAALAQLENSSAFSLRFVDRIVLKGERLPTEVFEVVWDADAATDARPPADETTTRASLCLTHAGRQLVVDDSWPEITIGRGASCDLIVPGHDVSWLHGRIQCRKGRPSLTDLSTNGTFIHPDGVPGSTRIHRDTVPLVGSGRLGLGRPPASGDDTVVTFACRIVL